MSISQNDEKEAHLFKRFCDIDAKDIEESVFLLHFAEEKVLNLVTDLEEANLCVKIERDVVSKMLNHIRETSAKEKGVINMEDLYYSVHLFNEMIEYASSIFHDDFIQCDEEKVLEISTKYDALILKQFERSKGLCLKVIGELNRKVFAEMCVFEETRDNIFTTVKETCKSDSVKARTELLKFLRDMFYLQINIERLKFALDHFQILEKSPVKVHQVRSMKVTFKRYNGFTDFINERLDEIEKRVDFFLPTKQQRKSPVSRLRQDKKQEHSSREFCDKHVKDVKDMHKTLEMIHLAQQKVENLIRDVNGADFCVNIEKKEILSLLDKTETGQHPDRLPDSHEKELRDSVELLKEISEITTFILDDQMVSFQDLARVNAIKSKHDRVLLKQYEIVKRLGMEVLEELYDGVFERMCRLEETRKDIFTTMDELCDDDEARNKKKRIKKVDREDVKRILYEFLRNIFYLKVDLKRLEYAVFHLNEFETTKESPGMINKKIKEMSRQKGNSCEPLVALSKKLSEFENRFQSKKNKE